MNTKNHPGVYVPPPLIYVAFFLLSFFLQEKLPLDAVALYTITARDIAIILIALFLVFCITSITQFIQSKNTLVPIKPANSLETSGIYSFTRNPMYLSLVCLYSGLAILFGNWWTLIFIPMLIAVVQLYVIKKEEQYLEHAFGSSYEEYKKRVRRWI